MKNKQKNFNTVLTFIKATSFTFVLVVLFFILAPSVLAQLETGIEYGTATGLGNQDIRISIMQVVRIFLGFVGVIALILVMYGGWVWMSSAGRPDRIEQAKAILRNAAIGLAIILLAFSIVSFIINLLQQATIGGGSGQGGGPPGGGCTNCGNLGTGIIERVYPSPFSRDNARNTNIMVTFKVDMDPSTIIEGASAACSVALPCIGTIVGDSISIYPSSDDNATLDPTRVNARSIDGKTFVFDPIDYLGNTNDNVWYSVELTNDIQKDNGDPAFPGASSFFIWRFEIGTFLDLDPVEVNNVFPAPDDSSDTYSTAVATQAAGSITITAQPNFAQNASTGNLTTVVGNPATLSGSYNCSVDSTICVNAVSPSNFNINPKSLGANCSSPNITVGGLASTATINAGSGISLGCGLTLTLDVPVSGNQWSFDAAAQRSADTLRVGNTTYTFVQNGAAGNQINLGVTAAATAQNIGDALDSNSLVDVSSVAGATVNLQAVLAGQSGNAIVLSSPATSRVSIDSMSGGQDAVLLPTKVDAPDQPRNAIVVVNFNEAVDPTLVSNQTILVEYFDGSSWVSVDGNYFVSNQFKTVEFLPDSQCLDTFNNPIVNSCGDPMFCLPVITPDPAPYEATPYRVVVRAGQLNTCASSADCSDPNFNSCQNSFCTGSFSGTTALFPEVSILPNGVADAANNTFNGNSNSYVFNSQKYGDAEGPQSQSGQSPFSLNTADPVQGDDLIWEFFVNKNIDLTPPAIEGIEPNINSAGVSTADPVSATFAELMMSKSLKPGTGYRDGLCGTCTNDNQCNTGEICNPLTSTCIADGDNEQVFCVEDKDCNAGLSCINKKYVTLIDLSSRPVGWWITNDGLDTVLPQDGYPDQSVGNIQHTAFSVVTNYGAEFGSGIQDVYQNCFIPSEGPDITGGSCNTTPTEPYCCSGQALSPADWQNSQCFTGF